MRGSTKAQHLLIVPNPWNNVVKLLCYLEKHITSEIPILVNHPSLLSLLSGSDTDSQYYFEDLYKAPSEISNPLE